MPTNRTYETKRLTQNQTSLFTHKFDMMVGTERETDYVGDGMYTTTCVDLNQSEVDLCKSIENSFNHGKSVSIDIELNNDAFVPDSNQELIRILQDTIKKIEAGHIDFPLADINGNRVGSFKTVVTK